MYEMDPQRDALWKEEGKRVSGEVLMRVGLQLERVKGDFQSRLYRLSRIERQETASPGVGAE